MSKKNDPNYIDARDYPEEKLNPNRPHEYRKTHNGISPVGRIQEIKREMKEKDPERYAEMERKRAEKSAQTHSMKKRAKDLLSTVINLSPTEREVLMEAFRHNEKVTVEEAILMSQITKAYVDRDTAAAAFVRDTSGQKPKDEVDHNVSIDNLLKNNGILEEEED